MRRRKVKPCARNREPEDEAVAQTDMYCVCRESKRDGEPSHIPESLIETRHGDFCRRGEASLDTETDVFLDRGQVVNSQKQTPERETL